MSKKFRPLFPIDSSEAKEREESNSFNETLNNILREKAQVEKELEAVKKQLTLLRKEKEELLARINQMESDLRGREEEIDKLRKALQDAKVEEGLTNELCSKLTLDVHSLRTKLLEDTLDISKKVLKDFLMTDILPREELITRVLEGIFEESIRLKGNVKIFVNPVHIDTVFNLIGELKAKADSELEIEVVGDESLNIGEVRVESPRFVIERLNDEAIEEIFREVLKSALEGS